VNRTITLTIPSNATVGSQFYYHCSAHYNMGGLITVQKAADWVVEDTCRVSGTDTNSESFVCAAGSSSSSTGSSAVIPGSSSSTGIPSVGSSTGSSVIVPTFSCTPGVFSLCVSWISPGYLFTGGVSGNNRLSLTTPTSRPSLIVFTGSTYTFTITSPGNFGNHPFVLTANDTGRCGSTCAPVDSKIATISGGNLQAHRASIVNRTITLTIPSNATVGSQFYYHCSAHYNMGGLITVQNQFEWVLDERCLELGSDTDSELLLCATKSSALKSFNFNWIVLTVAAIIGRFASTMIQ